METIKEHWDLLLQETTSVDAPAAHIEISRQIFYLGAMAMFLIGSKERTEEQNEAMNARLRGELVELVDNADPILLALITKFTDKSIGI